MADEENDHKVGPGRPPLHTRFRKRQSGNPGGRSKKKLHALLADALNEQVFVTVDGERRKITKREAVVHQLVNKSATADLRATKMLFDMIKEVEQKASVTSPTLQFVELLCQPVVRHWRFLRRPTLRAAATKSTTTFPPCLPPRCSPRRSRPGSAVVSGLGMLHHLLVGRVEPARFGHRRETPLPLIEMFDELLSLAARQIRVDGASAARVDDYFKAVGKKPGEFLFSGRGDHNRCMTTRQYARLVSNWLAAIGLDPHFFATHSLRRTKATLIYRRTGNLPAV
jgi:hypothetical protein